MKSKPKKKWLPWPERGRPSSLSCFVEEAVFMFSMIVLLTSCQTLTEGGSVAAGAATGAAVGGPGGAAVGGTMAYLGARVAEADAAQQEMVVLREEASGWFTLQDIVDKFWWLLVIVGILFLLAWLADSPVTRRKK